MPLRPPLDPAHYRLYSSWLLLLRVQLNIQGTQVGLGPNSHLYVYSFWRMFYYLVWLWVLKGGLQAYLSYHFSHLVVSHDCRTLWSLRMRQLPPPYRCFQRVKQHKQEVWSTLPPPHRVWSCTWWQATFQCEYLILRVQGFVSLVSFSWTLICWMPGRRKLLPCRTG